jgi:hypothetical protein
MDSHKDSKPPLGEFLSLPRLLQPDRKDPLASRQGSFQALNEC